MRNSPVSTKNFPVLKEMQSSPLTVATAVVAGVAAVVLKEAASKAIATKVIAGVTSLAVANYSAGTVVGGAVALAQATAVGGVLAATFNIAVGLCAVAACVNTLVNIFRNPPKASTTLAGLNLQPVEVD